MTPVPQAVPRVSVAHAPLCTQQGENDPASFDSPEAPGTPVAPRISVIIPVRNAAADLRRCLHALAESTLRDFEILVADDASKDDTASVAETLGARVLQMGVHCGSAAARNAAALVARGEILLFVDADVEVHPDSLQVVVESFEDPSVDAIFGSYDLEPHHPNLVSQYKNLAHRYYHQTARERACTFWTGCGAIRKHVFRTFGGFNASQFRRPMIEDIELGVRMTRAGRTVLINKRLQVKHLKRWSLLGMIKSDIRDRAIPWTRLILKTHDLPNDMNLASSQRISALLAGAFLVLLAAACWYRPWLALLPVGAFGAIALADWWTSQWSPWMPMRLIVSACAAAALSGFAWYGGWFAAALALPLVGVILLNTAFYGFFVRHRGLLFTAAVLPLHVLYYLYSAAVFAYGTMLHRLRPSVPGRPVVASAPVQPVASADVTTSQ